MGGIGDFFSGAAGALTGGAIGLGGSALGAKWARKENKRQRKWARTNMQKSVRWRVKDLRAAGINPILAAQGGLSGGLPSGSAASMPDVGGTMAKGAQAGLSAMMVKAQIANVTANTAKTVKQTKQLDIVEPASIIGGGVADVLQSDTAAAVKEKVSSALSRRNLNQLHNKIGAAINRGWRAVDALVAAGKATWVEIEEYRASLRRGRTGGRK